MFFPSTFLRVFACGELFPSLSPAAVTTWVGLLFTGKIENQKPTFKTKQNYSQDSDVGARNAFVFFLPPLSS